MKTITAVYSSSSKRQLNTSSIMTKIKQEDEAIIVEKLKTSVEI